MSGEVIGVFRRCFAHDLYSKGSEGRVDGQVCTLAGHSGPVTAIDFSPDGTRVVSASEDEFVNIYNTATGAQVSGH